MDCIGDILSSSAEFHRDHEFVDDLRALLADDVPAKQFSGVGVGDEFHESFGLTERFRFALLGVLRSSDRDLVALLFGFLFSEADVADLGIGEHRMRDESIRQVDRFVLREVPVQQIRIVARRMVNIGAPVTSPTA